MDNNNQKPIKIPDAFYDAILKDLPENELLNMNSLVTHNAVSRMTDEEKCNMIKRMAGYDGTYLLVGLDVIKQDAEKMDVSISEYTVKSMSPTIYPEIKDVIHHLQEEKYFDDMVVANQDKKRAREMIFNGRGSKIKLLSIFSFKEKLQILKKDVTEQEEDRNWNGNGRGLPICAMFNEEEKKEVFVELLKMKHPNTENYLESLWNSVAENGWQRKNNPQHAKAVEYLTLILKNPSPHAPIEKEIPKAIRFEMVKKGVLITGKKGHYSRHSYLVEDFTREELLECFKLEDLKSLAPDKLTKEELIKFGNEDASFLKEHLELYPKEYLKKRFSDPEKRKEFIGNRVQRDNRIANEKLDNLIGSLNPKKAI